MQNVTIVLRAFDYKMIAAWEQYFRDTAGVEYAQGDIFGASGDAIVSPANSFGYMDGGIDLVYSQKLGWELERRLREVLLSEHDGELPVGQAVVVPTGRDDIRYLVSAPTMRVPTKIADTVNVYLAFRAALRAVREHNRRAPETAIRRLLSPALGTGEGRMPHDRAARQMRAAYDVCVLGKVETKGGLARAVTGHIELMR